MPNNSLDITGGSLWKTIPLFALPVALTAILEQLSNLIGVGVIGRLSGAHGEIGMAAIGANTPIVNLMVGLCVGMSLGSTVVIATAIGAKHRDTVSKAVHTSLLMALFGLVGTALMWLFANPLLTALNVPADSFRESALFLRVYSLGLPLVFLYNIEAAIFRSIGKTKMPLQALGISVCLSVVFDVLFVAVFKWGVVGVALATIICYAASASYLLFRLVREESWIQVRFSQLRFDVPIARRIVKIGLPAGLQSAVFSIANIVIQSAIDSLGTTVIAASSAAFAVEVFVYAILDSFSQACTTFVGQNHGAGNIKRCNKTLIVSLVEDISAVGVAVVLMALFGKSVLALFNPDPAIVRLGTERLMYIFVGYFFTLTYECMSGYLRGFGVSVSTALLTVVGVCGVRLYWIFAVFPAHRTFGTIMIIYPISLAITTLFIFVLLLYFRLTKRGRKTLYAVE